MTERDDRLALIEARLERIEQQLALATTPQPPADPWREVLDIRATGSGDGPPDLDGRAWRLSRQSTPMLMALGAAASFILAGAYFVMLAYDAGWLTPLRQVVIAFVTGCVLIALGLGLSLRNRDFAAYPPAVGLTILYLAVYAGHLVYGLIPVPLALALITAVSAIGLATSWRFDNSVFAVLSAAGVYLTPLLIRAQFADLTMVVIYFSVWSLLFSFFALQEGRRATYLVALYLAMTVFDATWRHAGAAQWVLAASYHFVQFAIFAITAAAFSVRHRTSMDGTSALLHAIPLFYFYGLEYLILKAHAPVLVAPLGLSSVAVVIGLFLFARRRLRDAAMMRASASLVSAYAAFATSHILFFELLPPAYFVWGVLLLPIGLMFARQQLGWGNEITLPLALVGGLLFFVGFVLALLDLRDLPQVRFPDLALVLYATALYGLWWFARAKPAMSQLAAAALYLGHLAIVVVTVRAVSSGLAISIGWAFFAITLLVIAHTFRMRDLGQSSLVIFSASAFKVLVFDLDGSAPGIRITTLVILGGSLYFGGWLYQSLVRETKSYVDDPGLDAAIRMVSDLLKREFDDARIAAILARRDFTCPVDGGWNADVVATLREKYGLRA